MQNLTENNQIYLSGGGNKKQSFPLDKFFFNRLSKNGHFLYIPTTLCRHKLYLAAHLWMKSILELHKRTDVHFEIANDLSRYECKDINFFNALYIGGGNTWNLMQELRNSGFSDKLIQYFKKGGQIYGGSAGAIVLGKKIDTHDDKKNINIKDISGFNLLCGYSVACHFKNKQNDRFKEWAIHNNSPIICLPEKTGLIIKNGSALCVGTKLCVIYFANGTKKEIYPEESFRL